MNIEEHPDFKRVLYRLRCAARILVAVDQKYPLKEIRKASYAFICHDPLPDWVTEGVTDELNSNIRTKEKKA